MSVREELGVSDEDYEWLLEQSEHCCWICGHPERIDGRRLAVDHDHRTGAVRGLLCTSCNRRLGGTVDPKWLRRAAEYLEVAARAFGDNCRVCKNAAPSTLAHTKDGHSTFVHECCGTSWRISYATKGLPCAWMMGANPFPPSREPLGPAECVGHPGKDGG